MYPSFDRNDDRSLDRPTWRVGDRVLAPWEPQFLYAGTIVELRAGDAHINFDDGDCGWVPVREVQELAVEVEQVVMCRKQMGPLFYPALVEDVSGETIHVRFADGESEWTTVAAVRVPREGGIGAEATHIGSPHAFVEQLQRGLRVLAPWENFFLYPATVLEVQGSDVNVQFDDGDAGWVEMHQVHPLEIKPGLMVSVRGRNRRYQPGEVVSAEGEQVEVTFGDGSTRTVPLETIRVPCEPTGPNARPSATRQPEGGWSSAWGWLVVVGIIAGVVTVMRWLGN